MLVKNQERVSSLLLMVVWKRNWVIPVTIPNTEVKTVMVDDTCANGAGKVDDATINESEH